MTDTPENGGPAFAHGNPEQGGHSGMTKREYAAIKLRVPDSGTEWLDDMIRSAKRDYFAGQAITNVNAVNADQGARRCYQYADAMLRAGEGGNA